MDVAEEKGIVFMLEETCNRVKLALTEVKKHALVTIMIISNLRFQFINQLFSIE